MTRLTVMALALMPWFLIGACSDNATSQAASLALSPSVLPGAAQSAWLSGVVTSRETTTPIPAALVTILDGPNAGRNATTVSGAYKLTELQSGNANVSFTAAGYLEGRAGVFLEGATSLDMQLPEATPLVTFGPGQHRVGDSVAAGRYFIRPASGCYWERRSAAGGGPAETIAFGFIGFDATQWIVDIRTADYAFHANHPCGMWSNRASESLAAAIPAGMWLVGQQILPGTYSSSVAAGCYWERLADFTGTASSVIARELIGTPGTGHVTIFATDTGFRTDAACGAWMPAAPPAPTLRIVN